MVDRDKMLYSNSALLVNLYSMCVGNMIARAVQFLYPNPLVHQSPCELKSGLSKNGD